MLLSLTAEDHLDGNFKWGCRRRSGVGIRRLSTLRETGRGRPENGHRAGACRRFCAHDPLTHAGVVAVLLAVALAACWLPARRATRGAEV